MFILSFNYKFYIIFLSFKERQLPVKSCFGLISALAIHGKALWLWLVWAAESLWLSGPL